MNCVIIESPYKGNIIHNIQYAKECMFDSISRGEAPIASHLLYTAVLDDNVIDERNLGIDCGFEWMKRCDYVAVYIDNGISTGMQRGIDLALSINKPVLYRKLYGKQ